MSKPVIFIAAGMLALSLVACGGGHAPVVTDQAVPGLQSGSGNVASAEPNVARPAGTPCSVTLFQNVSFNNFDSHPFNYAATCRGPWQRVVLEADFSVNAGRQFDRTGHISLGGVNLWTGTTQEPSATVAPSWHVERDLTDYAPLFAQSGAGAVDLDNIVNETYTGTLKASARLVFYAQDTASAAPRTADMVIPLGARADGRPEALSDTTPVLSKTVILPRNVVRAFIDVLAQGQSDDEFWWSCAPDNLTDALQTCGGSAFREALVSIDDQPAGVAPVFPWIFTGGVNPRLWRPLPGVQTLNLRAQRVDLSPFSAILADGSPHKISVQVANAKNWFNVSANLLLLRDAGVSQVTGGLLQNNLAVAAAPKIDNRLQLAAGLDPKGDLATTSRRSFAIKGFVTGSQGREELSVQQSMSFVNNQHFDSSDSGVVNNFQQLTQMQTISTSSNANGSTSLSRDISFPFLFNINSASTGTAFATEHAYTENQRYLHQEIRVYTTRLSNTVSSDYVPAGTPAVLHASSRQRYIFEEDQGGCIDRTVSTDAALLVSAIDSQRCVGQPPRGKPWGKIASSALDDWFVLGN